MSLPLFARGILISVIFIGLSLGVNAQQQSDYYQRGQQAAEQGNTEEAINIWLQGKGALDVPDMRIGNAFIELVAEKELEEYYEFATLMYQWGLSAETVAPNKEALEDEIERLNIFVDYNTQRRWRNLWKDNDPQIYRELLGFWKQLDPTPTTGYNERLIEHWQRIAYSKKNFTRSKSGVFEADERAEVYIRYGKPDVEKDGILQFNDVTASSYVEQIANTPMLPLPKASRTTIQTVVRNAKNYHWFPEYEIWVYQKSSPETDKKTFIFGDNADTGEFEMMESVDDFIQNTAFNKSPGGNKRTSGITSGLVLQIVYYDQLSTADLFFGNMFESITSQAIDINSVVSSSLAQQMQNKARFELIRQRQRAANQESSYSKQMANIPVGVYQYRLLDEQNRPYFATFVESEPQKAFWLDYLSNYNEAEKDVTKEQIEGQQKVKQYEYVHTLQLYNADDELSSQLRDTPVIVSNDNSVSASLFEIPVVSEGARQVFTAKLQNNDPNSKYLVDGTPFKKTLRGLGKAEVSQPDGINSEPSQLQMGDLIVGFNYNEGAGISDKFPFTVANNKEIPINEDLVIHFEVYNMPEKANGLYNVSFSYQITPKGGLLSWFKKQEEDLKLTLNLESDKPRYVENLQIKTRELRPGSYDIAITVEDTATQQRVERTLRYEVVEE